MPPGTVNLISNDIKEPAGMSRFIVRRTLAALTVAAGCIAGAGLSAQQQPASPALLVEAGRVDRLEALVQRVEGIAAIKRLQYAYGHYAELGLWHDFADLFADTGIGHYTQGALDREGIRALFLKDVGQGQVGLADGRIYPHISMQPVVTLAADGQSGKGRWHIMAMLGGYGTSASWAGGVYENQYVRENGVWKMKDVTYIPQYSGRYENPGWTATRQPAPFHFEPSRVGKPILDVTEPPRATSTSMPPPPTLAALGRRMTDLAARAQRLSDEIEVTNLQHTYGYYADRKMWDEVANLFAADGTMEMGLQGVYAGKTSIRRGLNALGSAGLAAGETNDHIHLQTIVSVLPDGSARARGTDIGMTGTSGGRAIWSQSIYENEFVKQGGVWKFKAMHVYPRFIVDAEKGWAKDAQPAPGPSSAFPPDRPSTETYEIYPRFSIAPLHFNHPVTGRAPQYPEGAKFASASASASASALRATADKLASLLAATERSVERSKAYHASENLVTAYGYDLDEKSPTLTLHQVVQPVIHVSADARSATIRARLFQLGNAAGGEGSWTSGMYEDTSVDEGGTWKLSGVDFKEVWSAPSRGGWVRARTSPAPTAGVETRRFDQVHLASAEPAKAVEWYIKTLGAEPWPDDEPFRVKSGETRIIFLRSATAKPSLGGVTDHIGWSFPDVDAKMKEFQAAGIKIVSPVREIPGLYKAGMIEDPWGTQIQIVQDPATPGFHHVQLLVADPEATYKWFLSYFGGDRTKLKGRQDALKYGAVWLLASRGEGEESNGRAIDHIGFGTSSRPGSLAEFGAVLKAGGVTFKQEQHGIKVGSKPVQVFIIQGPAGCEIEILER